MNDGDHVIYRLDYLWNIILKEKPEHLSIGALVCVCVRVEPWDASVWVYEGCD